jgi:surface carbohydrate biosynthesis protein
MGRQFFQKNSSCWVSIEAQTMRSLSSFIEVAAQLRKRGFIVSFHSGNMGEWKMRPWLAKTQPDVLIVRGIPWGRRYRQYFDKNTNPKYRPTIIVIPAEHFYWTLAHIHSGQPKDSSVIEDLDLALVASENEAELVRSVWCKTVSREIIVTGYPGYDSLIRGVGRIQQSKALPTLVECPRQQSVVLIASRAAVSDIDSWDSRNRARWENRFETWFGVDKKYAIGLGAFHKALSKRYSEAISELASKHRNVKFLFKPHPSEQREKYPKRFAGSPNIEVVKEGAELEQLLQESDLLIGYKCGTFVEATLLGVPIINFVPAVCTKGDPVLEAGERYHPEAFNELADYHAEDLPSVSKAIEIVLAKSRLRAGHSGRIEARKQEIIARFIGFSDGEASARIGAAISNYMGKTLKNGSNFETSVKRKKRLARRANWAFKTKHFSPYVFSENPLLMVKYEIRRVLKNVGGRLGIHRELSGLPPVDIEKQIRACIADFQ